MKNNKLFCFLTLLSIATVCFADAESDLADKHLHSIKQVYKLTLFQEAEKAILTGVLPDVFNENVTGRVYDFALHLHSPMDVAEYFYALVPNRITQEGIPVVISRVDFNHFINNGQVAYTNTNYVISLFPSGFVVANSTQVGTWRFDDNDKIIEIDNFQPYYDITVLASSDPTSPAYQAPYVDQTCARHNLYCTGANQQYATYDDCVAFMHTLTFGSPDINQGNSTQCRWWHSILSKLRPSIHCPHVGPTGGGVCVPYHLPSLYDPFFPNDVDRLVGPASYVATIP